VQQRGRFLAALVGVGGDVFVVDVHACAEPHHGGERVHFGGRVQVHGYEALFVLDGTHRFNGR
jgi:hypothetical protein